MKPLKTKCWTGPMVYKLRVHKMFLSQKEFAQLIGCRQQTVSEWEMEIYNPGNAYSRILTFVERNYQATEKVQVQ
jgi:DNA-binding transcriptional regulator YiaG